MGTSGISTSLDAPTDMRQAQSSCKASSLIMNRTNSRDCGSDSPKSLDLPDTITNPAPKDGPTKYKAGVNPMSDWKTRYASKLVSAKEAASYVQNGDRIFLSSTCCEPTAVIEALGNSTLEDVEMIQFIRGSAAASLAAKGSTSFQIEDLLSGRFERRGLWNIRGRLCAAFPFANPGFFQSQTNSH